MLCDFLEELWLEGAEALLVSHSMDSTHDDEAASVVLRSFVPGSFLASEDWIASSSELSTQVGDGSFK